MFSQITKFTRNRKPRPRPAEPRLLSESDCIQRRAHFRMDCEIPVKVALLRYTETGQPAAEQQRDGIAINLSGGGMKLATAHRLQINDRLTISMNLDGGHFFIVGEVRAIYNASGTNLQGIMYSHATNHYGIMFSRISQTDQDKIIKYLLNAQKCRSQK